MAYNFTTYLNDDIKRRLESLYGKKYPELVDYEMRKLASNLNKQCLNKYGFTINDMNKILFNEGIYVDIVPFGYLYGNEIEETWEWANAITFKDEERITYLTQNKKTEEDKNKAIFISHYIEMLLNPDKMSESLKAIARKEMIKKYNKRSPGYVNMKHLCGYDWI